MVDVDYGQIRIKLAEYMEIHNISINKLAFRAEMQRTQLKAYMKEDVQRVDLAVLSRLCYALGCNLEELIEYIPPEPQANEDCL
jgi:putative transcriptional regulator